MSWDEWVRTVEVEPSLYAADFSRLGVQVEVLLRAGCRVFHWDVGDGHFIQPVTMGPIVLEWIAPLVHREGGVLDCHLMVEGPERHIPQFAEAGADSVTVHFETCPNLPDVVDASGLQVEPLGDNWPQFRHPRRPEFLLTQPHVHGTTGFFIARLRT